MTPRLVFICAFALAAILMFSGCQTAPAPAPKTDVAADVKAIKALSEQYFAAFNSSDAADIAATYADDAIEMPPNQVAIEGKNAIQAGYEAYFKNYADNSSTVAMTPSPSEIQVPGDWAYVRGTYTGTVTRKGGKPMEGSGKYLQVCKRQADDSWKFYRFIWNSNAPPPGGGDER